MTSSSSDDKPLRYACDRCHSQKLRCLRSVEPEKGSPEEPCSRCRKAGVPCVVSLRGKVGRPSKATKKKQHSNSVSQTPEPDLARIPTSSGILGMSDAGSSATPTRMDDDIMSSAGSRPCSDPRVFPDLIGPSLANLPYEPFIMDFDTQMDLSPFGMPHISGIPPPASGSLPGFDAETKTIDTAILQDLMDGDSSLGMPTPSGLFSHSDLSPMQAPSLAPDSLMSSTIPTTAKNSPSDETPLVDFSSTACYQTLSNLNLRILASTAKTGPTANNSAVILKDVVGFSGELIDTARQSMPYFSGSGHQTRGSIGSRTSSTSSGSEGGFSSTDSYFSGAQMGSVPESAVIFLLLGCYTQILHLFEVTTNCLWEQHGENPQSEHTKEDNSGTVGSLLEASLAIHTVTYLLSRLHRALAVGEGSLEEEVSSIDPHLWKKSFVGGKELEDGLLGRAFGEIRQRELWLMQRTQHLQRRINTCRI
ncbi:uncharacterized protein F5Z01DRAFT_689723 [Emericellopsis atlantica]|uniref:Zn(2)-C6 fungal-type domain-containing protein n=1 Tax=Emericellopsis atlantica TaxID=2614577 RepID=A0A9P8CW26_9HYPO|nr:uncharacterized protein F5Z01DRAFT_689723 [Emericellopsis atlantica]KAG9258406.1 hypothetical protein F5Z01DRAFT_689723 [Emericellopsis atlantica]